MIRWKENIDTDKKRVRECEKRKKRSIMNKKRVIQTASINFYDISFTIIKIIRRDIYYLIFYFYYLFIYS